MEIRRVFFNRAVLLLMLFLLAADAFLFVREIQEEQGNHASGYTEMLHEELKNAEGMTLEELEEESDRARAAFMLSYYVKHGETDTEEYQGFREECMELYPELVLEAESGRIDPTEASARRHILKDVLEQKSRVEEYGYYYEDMEANAERIRKNPIFQTPENLENIEKTLKDYAPVKDVQASLGDDRVVNMLFQTPTAEYLILAFMAFVCILLLRERKGGLWKAVHAAPEGRAALSARRIAILLLASFLSVFLLYGVKVLIAFSEYDGFVQWNRAIQSVEGFEADWQPDTIGGFLLRFLLVKTLSVFLFSLLFWFAISLAKQVLPVLLLSAGLITAEYVLYTNEAFGSTALFFRTLNFFSYLNAQELFRKYENIRVMGILVNVTQLSRVALLPLTVFAVCANVLLQAKMHPVRRPGILAKLKDTLSKKTNRFTHRSGLFGSECFKILFSQYGWILLLVLAVFIFTFGGIRRTPMSGADVQADIYYQIYEGEVTEEKLAKLHEEKETVLRIIEEEGSSDFLEMRLSGVMLVIDNAERLSDVSGARLVSPYDWTRFWGNDEYNRLEALKMIFLAALLFGGVIAYECESNMNKLLRSSFSGRGKLVWIKQAVSFMFALILFLGIYGREILELVKLPHMDLPAADLIFFRTVPRSITLGSMLLLLYIIRFLGTMLLMETCLLISRFSGKASNGQVASTVILTAPAALGYLGVSLFEKVSFLPLLTVTDWFGRG